MADPARQLEEVPLPEVTTVGSLGSRLPIGILSDDGRTLRKDFRLRAFSGRVDRQLAVWTDKNEDASIARQIAKIVSLLVSEVGGKAIALTDDGDSTAEQELEVLKWYNADVVYLWLYARIMAVTEWMELPYVCRVCGEAGLAKADLNSTEVRVINSPKHLRQRLDLKRGIKLRDGSSVARSLWVQPVKFSVHMAPGSSAAGASKTGYTEFREAVCGVDCSQGHYTLTDSEMDEIPKIDLLAIDRKSGRVSAGPDMRTRLKCPAEKCGAPIVQAFDWSYETFFDSSVPLSSIES
jgi:hypothetical protein